MRFTSNPVLPSVILDRPTRDKPTEEIKTATPFPQLGEVDRRGKIIGGTKMLDSLPSGNKKICSIVTGVPDNPAITPAINTQKTKNPGLECRGPRWKEKFIKLRTLIIGRNSERIHEKTKDEKQPTNERAK